MNVQRIIDLLATDKSRYFAQPHPIFDSCSSTHLPSFIIQTATQSSSKRRSSSHSAVKESNGHAKRTMDNEDNGKFIGLRMYM